MPGGAMISPLNSAGERTSTRASSGSPRRGRMSSRKARRRSRARAAGSRSPAYDGTSMVSGRPLSSQYLRPPLRMRTSLVAVQLELPVGPRGEPVVVVAVQDDRGVGPDARLGQQRREVLARRDVAADAVGQLARPVPADGAREMALLVGGRVDVDLDEADVRVVEVGLRPVAVDEGVLGGVVGGSWMDPSSWQWMAATGRLVGSRRSTVSRRTTVGRGG